MPPHDDRKVEKSLEGLKISRAKNQKSVVDEPVDSWEDEANNLELEENQNSDVPITPPPQTTSMQPPAPPPPTPISPSLARDSMGGFGPPYQDFGYSGMSSPSRTNHSDQRQDKTTAVAARLIAAGIGQKAPRRTEEERKYDQAMRAQERQRREKAKLEEERRKREKEQALKDIWGD